MDPIAAPEQALAPRAMASHELFRGPRQFRAAGRRAEAPHYEELMVHESAWQAAGRQGLTPRRAHPPCPHFPGYRRQMCLESGLAVEAPVGKGRLCQRALAANPPLHSVADVDLPRKQDTTIRATRSGVADLHTSGLATRIGTACTSTWGSTS